MMQHFQSAFDRIMSNVLGALIGILICGHAILSLWLHVGESVCHQQNKKADRCQSILDIVLTGTYSRYCI